MLLAEMRWPRFGGGEEDTALAHLVGGIDLRPRGDGALESAGRKKRGEAMAEERREAPELGGESLKPAVTAPSAGELGRDFLTGCVAVVIIGVVVFLLIPLLVLVLKLSLFVAIPIGAVVLLLFFTTLFGRIINTLRKRW